MNEQPHKIYFQSILVSLFCLVAYGMVILVLMLVNFLEKFSSVTYKHVAYKKTLEQLKSQKIISVIIS